MHGMPFSMAHVFQMSENYMLQTHLGCLFRMQIHGPALYHQNLRGGEQKYLI